VRYVALLRGIGPLNPNMRNEKLRGVFEDLGFGDVRTVITTGNVLFDADTSDVGALEQQIEAAWPERLGFHSTTIIRTVEEVQQLVATDPFAGEVETPGRSFQVTFLKHVPDPGVAAGGPEGGDFTSRAVGDRVICSVVDLTVARTPDLMRRMERTFGKQLTTRTWKTVHRIVRQR